jgi:hypothetical protein
MQAGRVWMTFVYVSWDQMHHKEGPVVPFHPSSGPTSWGKHNKQQTK